MSAHERQLGLLRFDVDIIDDRIAELLTARFRRLEEIARVKADAGMSPADPVRERAIAERIAKLLETAPGDVRTAVALIMGEVVAHGRHHVAKRMRGAARHDRADASLSLERPVVDARQTRAIRLSSIRRVPR